jgi:hypothetical protein
MTLYRLATAFQFSAYLIIFFLVTTVTGGVANAQSGLTEITLVNAVNNEQATADPLTTRQSDPEQAEDAPMLITISLDDQRLKLFRGTNLTDTSRVSSGKTGHSTPMGIYAILEKRKFHRSNIYSNAPMPYMQRLTWSGIALHESNSVPNRPASHGCVRLPGGFAKQLFNQTSRGVHVIIGAEEVAPYPITHPVLFQPTGEKAVIASLRTTASEISEIADTPEPTDHTKPLRIYITRTTLRDTTMDAQKMLNDLGYFVGEEDGAYGKQTIAGVKRFQFAENLKKTGTLTDETKARLLELSGKTHSPNGRLYVRQGQKPVFESPVEFRDAEKPLGTHLFVTTGFDQDSTSWIAVSMASRIPKSIAKDHVIDPEIADTRTFTSAASALDRLEIPPAARQFIESHIGPDSSFIISDNGWGRETGDGTDFIVPIY